jgi:hypothetical protein
VARLPPRRLVDAVGVDPGVDPAAADGGAVVAQLHERRQRPSGRDLVPVDLHEHGLGAGLVVLAVHRVRPRQVEDRPVLRVLGRRQLLPDDAPEVVEEPQLGTAVTLGLDRFLAPLQQPLRLGEGAFLLDVRRRRDEEHLGAALLRHDLAGRDLRTILPERRALDHEQVADDEPVQVGHAQSLRAPVRGATAGFWPSRKYPETLPSIMSSTVR